MDAAQTMAAGANLRDLKRRMILEAARGIFAARGLQAASMREIAQAAACTTGAIYPLFPGKEAILAALLNESLDKAGAALLRGLQAKTDAAQQLLGGLRGWLGHFRDNGADADLLLQGFADPALARDLRQSLQQALAPVRDTLIAIGHLGAKMAELETAALFAFLIGLLQSERSGLLFAPEDAGQGIDALLGHHLDALIARLTWE